MASIDGLLCRLEARADVARENERAAVSREVMRRMSDEELRTYEAALRRAKAGGGGFAEEDKPILLRVHKLYEEVGCELKA